MIREAARVYATSAASRTAIAAAGGFGEAEVGILPIPVDVTLFHPEPDEEWFARLERPTVVFVGRADDPRKNAALLLAAWREVGARIPDARLRLVGRRPAARFPPAWRPSARWRRSLQSFGRRHSSCSHRSRRVLGSSSPRRSLPACPPS